MTFKKEILEAIDKLHVAQSFIAKDFLHIANYNTVRSILNRLVKEDVIRVIRRGIYYKTRFSKILRGYAYPLPETVAFALGRQRNWTIAYTANSALNKLGLDTQVPARLWLTTDGSTGSIKVLNSSFMLYHKSNKKLSGLSLEASMVILALEQLGPKRIKERHISHLAEVLRDYTKAELLEKGKSINTWLYPYIQEISKTLINEKSSNKAGCT